MEEFWKVVQSGGPAVILCMGAAIAWLIRKWDSEAEERKALLETMEEQRKFLQSQKDALHERVLEALNLSSGNLKELTDMLAEGAEKAARETRRHD